MVGLGLSQAVERVHYCDLDRFLHWLIHYPDESDARAALMDANYQSLEGMDDDDDDLQPDWG